MLIILMFTSPPTSHTSPPPEGLGVGPTLPHLIKYSKIFEKWYYSNAFRARTLVNPVCGAFGQSENSLISNLVEYLSYIWGWGVWGG